MRAIAVALVLGSTLGLSGSVATYGVSGPQPPEAPRPAAGRALPLMFEPGRSGEDFRARGRGYDVTVGRYGAALRLRDDRGTSAIEMRFRADAPARLTAERPLSTRVNYLRGSREQWRTGVKTYGAVRAANVYPGVDALFYGTDGNIEYDLVVAPGASPGGIRLSFVGSDGVETKDGVLDVRAQGRTLVQRPAVAYQEIGGRRVPVDVRYRVTGRDVGFDVGPYDRTQALVIDPIISYSTYFGATGIDTAKGVAMDAAGNAYVVGTAGWDDMPGPSVRPHTPQRGSSSGDDRDAYVAKFRPDGSVEWVSYIGGTLWDIGQAVAVGPGGDVYVGGDTHSPDFPTTAGAFHTAGPAFGEDEFLLRLAPDGTTFQYSTTLGAEQPRWNGELAAIAVDAAGRAYVVGTTGSNTFPATAWDSRSPASLTIDNVDAFVARFSSDGARLDWSRLFGGSAEDYANALSIDRYGAVYVVGTTCSTDFTVLNALFPTHFGPSGLEDSCSPDGFLTYVWNDGSLGFSTYLGGTGSDWMTAVGQGLYDRVFVGGTSTSPPQNGAYKPSTGQSGVVYQITPNGNALLGTRYVGSSGDSQLNALVFTPDPGWFWVLGTTDGAGWPYGYQRSYPDGLVQGHPGGGPDFFLQKWDALRMDSLGYSDTYGGGGADYATGIAVNGIGDIVVTGFTRSDNFPLTNAVQASLKPAAADAFSPLQQDGVVARFNCDIYEVGATPTQPAAGGDGRTWTHAADGCVKLAVSEASWLHVTGYQSYAVTFSTDPNPTASTRTGYIVISGRDRVPVTQAAGTAPPPPPPPPPPSGSKDEVVLDYRDVSRTAGTWQLVGDEVHGSAMLNPDAGQAKVGSASASPANYYEMTFTADAGKPYHLWIHGKAQSDSWQNDSVYVQFSDAVDAAGAPMARTGTTAALWVSLEECSGCGEQGWGWQDNAYGAAGDLGPDVYFAASGTHTIRLQQREDGFEIGQVVLSAKQYLRTPPGGNRNDPKTVKPATAPSAAIDEIVLWTAGRSSVHGAWSVRNDTTAAGSAAVGNPDAGAPKAADPSASPASYVDITFNADAGKPYHLWLRLKADNDDWHNDSVWLQFSGSVDAAGNPVNRIGTTSGTWVSLEECSGCGEQGWGWQDNAYGSRGDLGPSIYFAASGPQTIRMQIREDGLSVDQIVLSAGTYSKSAPGAAKNDATILKQTIQP